MNDKLVGVAAVAFLTGALAVAAVPAAAQQGIYAGGSIGQFKEKDVTGETATGFKLFGGYQVNKNFAAEAGYVSTGTAKLSGLVEFKATGFTLAGVGIAPINDQFSVFGTVGLFSWSADLTVPLIPSLNASASGSDIFFGVGATYNVSRNLSIRGEFDSYKLGGDADTTVTAFTIGAQYRF